MNRRLMLTCLQLSVNGTRCSVYITRSMISLYMPASVGQVL
jgi:hypothetical protein